MVEAAKNTIIKIKKDRELKKNLKSKNSSFLFKWSSIILSIFIVKFYICNGQFKKKIIIVPF